MATKTDFTAEEWKRLRDTPHLVAAAVMLAGRNGLVGGFQEALAGGKQIYQITESGDPLFKALASPDEAKEAQSTLRGMVSLKEAAEAPGKLREAALRSVAESTRILESKGLTREASAFRKWCEDIGEAVARAAKEGGFLGFGGTEVSEEERKLLADLHAVTGAGPA
jgi:hypothetical protein